MMLSCRDYIFQLTSGQLGEAGPVQRVRAAQHRLMCRRCRAYTHNDQRLDAIVQGYAEHIQQPQHPKPGADDAG